MLTLSLRDRPTIRVINNNDPFIVAIRVNKVIYFQNGTTWGELVFESPIMKPGQAVEFELDKPGDYVVFTVPWPWLGAVEIRVVP